MCHVEITSPKANVALDFHPSQDFISCLFTAAIAALPAFLESFMTCLSGTPASPGYNPGDRTRCE
jgi:hypothetical protein